MAQGRNDEGSNYVQEEGVGTKGKKKIIVSVGAIEIITE